MIQLAMTISYYIEQLTQSLCCCSDCHTSRAACDKESTEEQCRSGTRAAVGFRYKGPANLTNREKNRAFSAGVQQLIASHSSMAAISANKSANNLLEGIDGDYVPKNILITGKMTCTRSHCCLLARSSLGCLDFKQTTAVLASLLQLTPSFLHKSTVQVGLASSRAMLLSTWSRSIRITRLSTLTSWTTVPA
jgi:hypothetical protein